MMRVLVIVCVSSAHGALKAPRVAHQPVQTAHRNTKFRVSRRHAMLAGLVPALVAVPQSARAAFGPSSAAVGSKPPLTKLDIEAYLALTPEKLAIRLSSISRDRQQRLVDDIASRLSDLKVGAMDELIRSLEELKKETPSEAVAAEINTLEASIKKASRLLALDKDIKAGAKRTARLDAQPSWVVYGSAALASVGSTLVMHPVDTYKTLQQTAGTAGTAAGETSRERAPHSGGGGGGGGGSGGSGGSGNGKGGDVKDGSEQQARPPLRARPTQQVAVEADGQPQEAVLTAVVAEAPGEIAAGGVEIPPLAELYRGLLPNILKEAPSSALYLGIYELIKARLIGVSGSGITGPLSSNPLLGYLIAGAVGELVGSVVRAPSEACKTRVQSGMATDAAEAVQQVLIDETGRRNTINAWLSSICRDVPMGAFQIAIFESLKVYVVQSPEIVFNVNTLPVEASFGAIGGLVGAALTTPADVVTTQIMTRTEPQAGVAGNPSAADDDGAAAGAPAASAVDDDATAAGDEARGRAPGPLATAKFIYETEGIGAFGKGVVSRSLYWSPAIGIFLALYCSLRQAALNAGL